MRGLAILGGREGGLGGPALSRPILRSPATKSIEASPLVDTKASSSWQTGPYPANVDKYGVSPLVMKSIPESRPACGHSRR